MSFHHDHSYTSVRSPSRSLILPGGSSMMMIANSSIHHTPTERSLNTKLQRVLEKSRTLLVRDPTNDTVYEHTSPRQSRSRPRDDARVQLSVASSSDSRLSSAGSVSSIGGGNVHHPDRTTLLERAEESSRLINAPGADSWANYNRQLRSHGFDAVPVIAGSSRLGEPTLVDGRKLFENCINVLQEYSVRNRQLLAATPSGRRDSPRDSSKLKEVTRANWKLQQEIEKLRRELDASVVERSSNSLTSEARTRQLERVRSQQSGEIRRLHHQCQRQEIELERMRNTMQKMADEEEMRRKKDREFAEKAVKSVCRGGGGVKNQGSLHVLQELAAVYRRRIERLEKEVIASGKQSQDLASQLTSAEEEIRLLQRQLSLATEAPEEDSVCGSDEKRSQLPPSVDEDVVRALEESLRAETAARLEAEAREKEHGIRYSAKIAALEREVNTARHELAAAEATLVDRPTMREVQLLKNKIERLEKSREERDRWRCGDVREMIRRDKESHKLGADIAVAEMDSSMMQQVLLDCCRHLKISEPSILPDALKKLGEVLDTALPRMTEFIRFVTSKVCGSDWVNDGQHEGPSVFAPLETVEARLRALLAVERELRSVRKQLDAAESAIDGEAPIGLPLEARIASVVEELNDRRTTETAFGEATERIYSTEEPRLITDRMVKHYMTTFEVNQLEHVCGSMSRARQRWLELENFWKALCSDVLRVDPSEVSTAKAILLARKKLSRESSG
ncbi:Be158, putative [Perkinsus marinus ATCC 50983]|uniref:Centrosomal protein of 70 kDa n=1 Tax=Perkinsus marinus (strain ATCC 50983 / TXsc) TaxID=423536 RepID=C5LZW6_PERM5|nr:Be158, putative [Perkinsus marinus ATCC 50983]EEQ97784.1 Be158, putative [Perkinsus marinus ATCC 50983]|eukprot:XP_002765067.1 Be158, putative [Perkinsus marinus ATCC 50983]